MNQGPRWVLLMKKNGGGKSHATVPLRMRSHFLSASPTQYCMTDINGANAGTSLLFLLHYTSFIHHAHSSPSHPIPRHLMLTIISN